MILLSFTTFLSSLLLFTSQLIVGKRVLPWFGGGASIWTTSMLFFMLFLFFGYVYVNFLSKVKKQTQIRIHLGLIAASLLATSLNYLRHNTLILPYPEWLPTLTPSPSQQILVLIMLSIGLPYLLLSTTSTLLQHWFTIMKPGRSPYFLYVISNIGSFMGLIAYPFIIEPTLTLTNQENLWLILFFVFTYLIIRITNKRSYFKEKTAKVENVSVVKSKIVFWIALSTVSNIALLSTTSQITQSISPVPFLWILPLSLFLLSFIIAFSGDSWYSRPFHSSIMLFSILCTVLVNSGEIYVTYWAKLGITMTALFLINLICHTELYKSRPKPASLVTFYTAISFGGVLASFICAVIAPSIFIDLWEFPLSLTLPVAIFLFITITQSTKITLGIQKLLLGSALIFLVLYQFRNIFLPLTQDPNSRFLLKTRNFYGVLKVTEHSQAGYDTTRHLTNGNIDHGHQAINSATSYAPTSYYTNDSGGGLSILNHPKRTLGQPMRIGVIGLGVGTMASYCEPGDTIRFYEINPKVVDISSRYFTYTSHCKENGGQVDIVLGDARLTMAQEMKKTGSQKYDVIVVDAFTDDAIPVHLITKEAVLLLSSHLADGGVIAFHISNLYLSLDKVLDNISADLGYYSYPHSNSSSVWYMVTPWFLKKPFEFYQTQKDPSISMWTDDHSNILEIFKN